jgi:hypothetical protein
MIFNTQKNLEKRFAEHKKKLATLINEEQGLIKEMYEHCQKLLLSYHESQETLEELQLLSNRMKDELDHIPPVTPEEITEAKRLLKKIGKQYQVILHKKRFLLKRLKKIQNKENDDKPNSAQEEEIHKRINTQIATVRREIDLYFAHREIDEEEYEDNVHYFKRLEEEIEKINDKKEKSTKTELAAMRDLLFKNMSLFCVNLHHEILTHKAGNIPQIVEKLEELARLEKERKRLLES